MLLAANSAVGEALAHAVVDGQLYFSGRGELLASAGLVCVVWPVLRWLTPRLIAGRLMPAQEKASVQGAWRWHFGFDVLVALAVAISTASIGLMASFALLFIPSWLAFSRARNWRQTNLLAIAISLLAYLAAFFLALQFDQPFGPTLCALLVLLLPLVGMGKK
jgi:zinc transport system permease protein